MRAPAAWALLVSACGPSVAEPSWCTSSGEALGTTWNATWADPDGSCDEQEVRADVAAALAEVDRQMSTWRDDSELSAVRRGPGPVAVSRDTAEVVRHALALAAATEGAYDPTVQPLMEVWGFHGRERKIAAPTPEALAEARSRVGWSRVRIVDGLAGPSIDAGGTALDLSSIAKGHAVDRASTALSRRGLADHLMEVGGEVVTAGRGPAGAWRLGVEAPEEGLAPGQKLSARVAVTNAALATSGNYRNAVEVDGRRVHHTMDPRTGEPALSDVASVSVVAPDCRTADALATAVMVLGSDRGLALLEAYGDVEGLVLVQGPDGWQQRTTPGMGALLLP
jgi:thiamine biosynthesis lipoprotein